MADDRSAIPANARIVSIQADLSSSISWLLREEQMYDAESAEALAGFISFLSHYTEEGQPLFPETFVIDDLEKTSRLLPNSETVAIGSGSKSIDTLRAGLKRCAPLAQWGWSIYVERREERFNYGLLRSGGTILSLSVAELLIEHGHEQQPAIVIRHASEHAIEIRGALGNSILASYGEPRERQADAIEVLRQFCAMLIRDAPEKMQEQGLGYFRRVLANILRGSHGSLAVIVSSNRRTLPPRLRDGVILSPPIDIIERIAALSGRNDCESDARLRACAGLIRGMLQSDGITVFGSDGTVRAYNVFVKHPRKLKGSTDRLGGARRRAFQVLCSLVEKEITGALFQSRDGRMEFFGGAT